MAPAASLPEVPVPRSIRSRYLENINGLTVHILEAGFETPNRPCLLLLHGFPELAFCWRRVMPALAEAGYHVIAPDQRGYGRTTGWDPDYDGDLASFRMINLVRDALGVVSALGYSAVDAIVGHDFGSPVAAWCALLRPDIFRSVALMSAPFAGPPGLRPSSPRAEDPVLRELASLARPRKHYNHYYSSREANAEMLSPRQGLHDFLRAYYHYKSADFQAPDPHPLKAWTAQELAKLPTYYVMDLNKDMAETVAEHMPASASISSNTWLSGADLTFCAAEFARTGFQGGLQWYRCATSGQFDSELQIWSGRTIDVPSVFISGKQDWGTYQRPGAYEAMQLKACTRMVAPHHIDGAGHWVQQEQPEEVARLLLTFLGEAASHNRN
ncbi:MAG TPA: alpha/beta hydrolase [Caulobacteraceae bacterium]